MRRIILIVAIVFFLFAGTVVTALSWEGWGSVRVRTVETSPSGWTIPLPMSVAHLAMAFAPREELRKAMGDWAPGLVAALDALEDAPDGILIQVETPDESVRIEKLGQSLRIHVLSEEKEVVLTLPLGSLTGLARSFETTQI